MEYTTKKKEISLVFMMDDTASVMPTTKQVHQKMVYEKI